MHLIPLRHQPSEAREGQRDYFLGVRLIDGAEIVAWRSAINLSPRFTQLVAERLAFDLAGALITFIMERAKLCP